MKSRFQSLTRPQVQRVVSLIVIVALTLNGSAQVDGTKPRTVTLKRGQELNLSLVTPLDSRRAQVGEEVELKLARPLVVDGVTVLPLDWAVRGQITNVIRAGKNCKSGQVNWKLGPLIMTDGKRIKIQFLGDHDYAVKQKGVYLDDQASLDTTGAKIGRAAKDVALVPVLVLFSPFIIPMAIAMSADERCRGAMGEEGVIPAGTVIFVAVSKNVKVIAH